MALLEVSHLDVRFALRQGEVRALRDVNFTLERGERLGIVGESGAGKSVAAFSLLNLIAKPGLRRLRFVSAKSISDRQRLARRLTLELLANGRSVRSGSSNST